GGKPAMTHYKMLEEFGIASLIECKLETGRTHQIRVHMTHIGHPLVGDPVYGQTTGQRLKTGTYKKLDEEIRNELLGFDRQALHAIRMGFIHPKNGKEMEFEAPLPDDMRELIAALRKN